MIFWYRAYGLTISSEIACFAFLPHEAVDGQAAQVVVSLSEVPQTLDDPRAVGVLFQAAQGQFLLSIPGVARYLALEGKRILVEREPGSRDDEVSLFLHEPVFAALLQQRMLLTLHGSAIQTPKGGVAFVGHSARGKSTLAAALAQRGYPVLADEICAIDLAGDGAPTLNPAGPYLYLWADMLEELGFGGLDLAPVRPGKQKYAYPLGSNFGEKTVPLTAIYCLSYSNQPEPRLEGVNGLDRFALIKQYTYMPRFIDGFGLQAAFFRQAMALVKLPHFARLIQPERPVRLKDALALLETDWK